MLPLSVDCDVAKVMFFNDRMEEPSKFDGAVELDDDLLSALEWTSSRSPAMASSVFVLHCASGVTGCQCVAGRSGTRTAYRGDRGHSVDYAGARLRQQVVGWGRPRSG